MLQPSMSCWHLFSVQQIGLPYFSKAKQAALCDMHRFPGENGQVSEFELRPSWRLPLQEAPEDWDINPATEELPLDQVLAAAADVRQEHLAGWALQLQPPSPIA